MEPTRSTIRCPRSAAGGLSQRASRKRDGTPTRKATTQAVVEFGSRCAGRLASACDRPHTWTRSTVTAATSNPRLLPDFDLAELDGIAPDLLLATDRDARVPALILGLASVFSDLKGLDCALFQMGQADDAVRKTEDPERFRQLYETPFHQNLWAFLTEHDNVIRAETASERRRPSVEPLGGRLLERFGDQVEDHHVRRMIGHMMRQVMERRGFTLDRSGVRIPRDRLFVSGTRYR